MVQTREWKVNENFADKSYGSENFWIYPKYNRIIWCGGIMTTMWDQWLIRDHRFKSESYHYHLATLDKLFTHLSPNMYLVVTKKASKGTVYPSACSKANNTEINTSSTLY